MDVLSKKQLEAQLTRQEATLEEMKRAGRSAGEIRIWEKVVDTTRRRFERAQNADYEEEVESVQRIGGEKTSVRN